MRIFDTIKLTLKYWLQGDTIKEAYDYARAIVYGFKRQYKYWRPIHKDSLGAN